MKYFSAIITLAFFGIVSICNAQGWVAQTSGTTKYLASVFFLDANTGWAAGNNIVLKTTNGGANWTSLPVNTTPLYRSVYFADPNKGWIIGSGAVVSKTTDGGTTWNGQSTGIYYGTGLFSGFFPDTSNGCVVGAGGTIVKTTDGGSTWTIPNSPTSSGLWSVYFVNATTAWAVGAYDSKPKCSAILKTTNGGTSWYTQTNGVTVDLNSVRFTNATTGWIAGSAGRALFTADSGAHWTSLIPGGSVTNLYSVYPLDANNAWVVGSGGAIWKTTDGGITWPTQTSGTTRDLRSVFFVNATTGWVVGDSGTILKTTSGGNQTSVQGNGIQLHTFALHQNYPNPFNPTTVISYQLSELSHVSLKIYDLLGREVATLVNEQKSAGTYTHQWNATNIPSGLYFYRLQAGSFTDTKKLVLLR